MTSKYPSESFLTTNLSSDLDMASDQASFDQASRYVRTLHQSVPSATQLQVTTLCLSLPRLPPS